MHKDVIYMDDDDYYPADRETRVARLFSKLKLK